MYGLYRLPTAVLEVHEGPGAINPPGLMHNVHQPYVGFNTVIIRGAARSAVFRFLSTLKVETALVVSSLYFIAHRSTALKVRNSRVYCTYKSRMDDELLRLHAASPLPGSRSDAVPNAWLEATFHHSPPALTDPVRSESDATLADGATPRRSALCAIVSLSPALVRWGVYEPGPTEAPVVQSSPVPSM